MQDLLNIIWYFYYKLATILYRDGSYEAGRMKQRNPFKIDHFLPGGAESQKEVKQPM